MFSMLHPLDEITPLVCKSGGKFMSVAVLIGVRQCGITCSMCHVGFVCITERADNDTSKTPEVGVLPASCTGKLLREKSQSVEERGCERC